MAVQGDKTILSYNEAKDFPGAFVEGTCKTGNKILIPLGDLGNMIPEGKVLMDANFANGVSFIHNEEFIFAIVDESQRLLFGIKTDGTPVFTKQPVVE